MSINIRPYTPALKNDWNTFVSQADNSTFLFERDFMDYHQDRFIDFSVLLLNDSKIEGVFPANIIDKIVYSHKGLTYGGLILRERKNVKKLISYYHSLFTYYVMVGVEAIVYKPVPNYLSKTNNDFEHFVLNLLDATQLKTDTSFVIDLQKEVKFQDRRSRNIKKAKKAEVEIRSDNDFDSFWNSILIPNLDKKFESKPVHSFTEIETLHKLFPDRIAQINAYLNNAIVAGVTLFNFRNCTHCQYISSTELGRASGALDLLINDLISQSKLKNRYFSLGTSNNHGRDINIGLSDWKEGWGAEIRAHFHYKLNPNNSKNLFRFI